MFPLIGSDGKITCTISLSLQLLFMLLFAMQASAGLYEWETNGPYGGDTRAIAIDPIYPTTLYAGLNARGGIYKSTNGGDSWSAIGSGLMDSASVEVYGVYSIAIDPITPTTLYAATYNGGVFKSTNGGSNWQQSSNGITHLFINTIAIDPTNPNIVYAGSGGGFFRSMDGGNSWQNASTGIKDPIHDYIAVFINKIIIDPKNVRTLYLGTNSGVFKSTNGGDSWTSVNSGLTDIFVAALAIDPNNTNVLYVGVGDGVFKSSNGGDSWRPVNTGLPAIAPYPINSTIVKVNPVHSDTIYTLINAGLFTSSNGGDTWSQLTYDARVNEVEIDPTAPNTLYMGTYGDGISKSIDYGNSWSLKKLGISGSIITSVVQDPTVPTTVYAGDNGKGVLKSTNGGGSWSSATTGLSNKSVLSLAINPATPSTLYAGTITGVFRTTNSGDSWSLVGNVDVVRAMAIDQAIPSTVYAATDDGIFKSTNSGDAWSKVSIDLPSVTMRTIVVDPGDSHTVYAGTQLGVFKSTNGGANWNQMYLGMKDPSLFLFVNSIAIDPINTGTIYAASERGVYKSTNGGDSWSSTSDSIWFSVVVIDPTNRNTVYAIAGHDFWVSIDGGGSWYKISTNRINGVSIFPLSLVSASPNIIYAGAHGGGVNSMTLANSTTIVANPPGAAYVSARNVALFANKPASIYYTTDGSDPTTSPTRQAYSALIPVAANTTLKSYGVDSFGIAGSQNVANYVIDTVAPTTTPAPDGAAFASAQSVSLACSDGTGSGCTTTYYCLGTGCTPTTVYAGPIPISSTTDLRYYSSDVAGNREAIKTSTYCFNGSLTVSIIGSGSVHGTSTLGQNYSCALATCPAIQYAYGDTAILMATDSADYHFAGWSGACTATYGDCILLMTANRSVTASFNFVSPVRLYNQSGSHDYGNVADAYAGIADNSGGTIACREPDLIGRLNLDRPVTLLLKGGYDITFSSNASHMTVLQGGLTVGQGSLTVENIAVR